MSGRLPKLFERMKEVGAVIILIHKTPSPTMSRKEDEDGNPDETDQQDVPTPAEDEQKSESDTFYLRKFTAVEESPDSNTPSIHPETNSFSHCSLL